MEEMQQITLDQWMQWKEDIRKKLQETASNFVYIGYRLKQIRDSGRLDGAADIFEFAKNEYGLGKSTVSRFIAINEKFSENGNSLELREEFRNLGSSKLAEMLTLTDTECLMITEKTTVKEIRELKSLSADEMREEKGLTPFHTAIRDIFSDKALKDILNMALDAETDEEIKKAAEALNPANYKTVIKNGFYIFMYEYNRGLGIKDGKTMQTNSMSYREFIETMKEAFWEKAYLEAGTDYWSAIFDTEKQEEKVEETQQNQGFEASVATSQQVDNSVENEEKTEGEEAENEENVDNFEEAQTESEESQEEESDEEETEEVTICSDDFEGDGSEEESGSPSDYEGEDEAEDESLEPEIDQEDEEELQEEHVIAQEEPEIVQKEELQLIKLQEFIEEKERTGREFRDMPAAVLEEWIQKLVTLAGTLTRVKAEKEADNAGN